MSDVEHVVISHNKLGEGPLWNAQEQVLYWLDVEQNLFQTLKPGETDFQVFDVGTKIGALAMRAAGGLVMATKRGFAFWHSQSQELEIINDPEGGNPAMRFNDGKIDRQGRFWAGSMYDDEQASLERQGSLYRLDPDLSVHKMDTGIAISNGLDWSLDNKTMYYTDSIRKLIYTYDFDPATGAIENRRTFVDSTDERGVPDGLTLDSEGYIWSARWGGGKIVRYDPAGQVEREIKMPVKYPTSCMFGGADLDELYVTSGWMFHKEEQLKDNPQAGDLFKIKTGFKGLVQTAFAG